MKKWMIMLAAAAFVSGLAAAETFNSVYNDVQKLRDAGKRKEALAACKKAEKLAKNDLDKSRVYFFTGVLECETGDCAKGIETLRKTLEYYKHPHQKISCQFHIAYYLGALKKYDEAIAEMKQALVFGKGAQNSYLERAEVYICQYMLYQKKYKEAMAEARKVKARMPENQIMLLSVIFESAMKLGDKKTAQESVEKMLAIKCDTGSGYFTARRHGNHFYRVNKAYDKALACANEISANKKIARIYQLHGNFYAALTLEAMGKKAEAAAQWKILEKSGDKTFVPLAKKRLAPAKKAKK